MTNKSSLKKSLVAFLDILGFSKRFPQETDSCIDLISRFSEYNGIYSDIQSKDTREIRASALSFSDNVAISIPLKIATVHTDEFHTPVVGFLHAVSSFAYAAIEKGFYIRGAIAYGEVYQTKSVIAGEPFIEAVKYEKIAYYPRIILAPTALSLMKGLHDQHYYGWSPSEINSYLHISKDSIDDTSYFDWLNFPQINEANLTPRKQLENKQIIDTAQQKLNSLISSTKEIELLQKLNWLKKYIDTYNDS